jgi:hypothetical protein
VFHSPFLDALTRTFTLNHLLTCSTTQYQPHSIWSYRFRVLRVFSSLKMARRQPQAYGQGGTDTGGPAPTQSLPRYSRGPIAPISVPRVSQGPMNLERDDPGDAMTLDTASSSKDTADSLLSFDSMRDLHDFIREVNGRQYNARNTTYFLPAGELNQPDHLQIPHLSMGRVPPSPREISRSLTTPSPHADQIEYSRLCAFSTLDYPGSVHISRSETSNIFAIALLSEASCTLVLKWSTSSCGPSPALRRRSSILVSPLSVVPSIPN